MNIQLPTQMEKPAFLDWLDRQDERYELVGGRVVTMARPKRTHAIIVSNLHLLLRHQLDPQHWTVIADFGLDAGPRTIRFPDIIVDRAGGAPDDSTATAPVFAAEVPSPSTASIDLGDKPAEFAIAESRDLSRVGPGRSQGLGLAEWQAGLPCRPGGERGEERDHSRRRARGRVAAARHLLRRGGRLTAAAREISKSSCSTCASAAPERASR
jgi:hypothetical protein